MPTSVRVTLEGWGELETALRSLGPKVKTRSRSSLKKGGELIADYARVLVPVDTGRLQDSITVVSRASESKNDIKAAIGFKAGRPSMSRRASFVEYGTVKSAPQPFMRPAIDANGEDAIAVIGADLWSEISKAKAKARG